MLIPAETTRYQQEVKKSKFMAYIAHASSSEDAHKFIKSIKLKYADANHVCWAYIAGEANNTTDMSCSDAGEPSGTAGKPILNVIQHSGISEVVAVVVRYFGGTKLGTGGLVRAYSSTVTGAMKMLSTTEMITTQKIIICIPYAFEDAVRRVLSKENVRIMETKRESQLHLVAAFPDLKADQIRQLIVDQCRGNVEFLT